MVRSPLKPPGSFADAAADRYNGRLAARPLLTQSITTAVLFATGDITAQQLVDQRGLEKHDFARTGRMALYGGGEFSVFSFIVCVS